MRCTKPSCLAACSGVHLHGQTADAGDALNAEGSMQGSESSVGCAGTCSSSMRARAAWARAAAASASGHCSATAACSLEMVASAAAMLASSSALDWPATWTLPGDGDAAADPALRLSAGPSGPAGAAMLPLSRAKGESGMLPLRLPWSGCDAGAGAAAGLSAAACLPEGGCPDLAGKATAEPVASSAAAYAVAGSTDDLAGEELRTVGAGPDCCGSAATSAFDINSSAAGFPSGAASRAGNCLAAVAVASELSEGLAAWPARGSSSLHDWAAGCWRGKPAAGDTTSASCC